MFRLTWHRVSFVLLAGLLLPLDVVTAVEQPLQPRPAFAETVIPFVEAYCVDCHSGSEAEAGFKFDSLVEQSEINRHRKAWQKALKQIRAGQMPPEDADIPSDQHRADLITWLDTELSSFDCDGPQKPGHVTLRRLNRNEYRNTIRDLVGVDFDPTETFPRDTLGYGFDNIGDVLSLSPLLVEKYLDAAEQIAAAAIVAPESILEPSQKLAYDQLEGGKADGRGFRNLFSNGRVKGTVEFPAPGEYLLRISASATLAGDELARMIIDLDQRQLRAVQVEANRRDPQTFVARFYTDASSGELGASFVNDFWDPDKSRRDRNLYVHSFELIGPITTLDPERLPASHRRVLPWSPAQDQWKNSTQWQQPTRTLIEHFLSRAYRRPPTAEQVDAAMQLVARAHQAGDSFERAMQLVVQLALVSPSFLFRGETPPDEVAAGSYPIDQYDLASRLSYFLWSSMPDEDLFREAAAGTLRENLNAQLRRMLASERTDELLRNFGEQWLETRRLETLEPNAELFPEFNAELAAAMREETFLLLRDVFRGDLPIATLLSADYSFLNEQLAHHYGIDGVEGPHFRRVSLPESRQAGLIAHGSVMAVTSHPDRTSPVLRGKWIMQHLFNDAPPPPPVVADLAEDPQSTEGKSFRERLEVHRASPSCNVCHKVMDPMGFALENFDPLGRWRDTDGEFPIDSTGQLPDGRQFSGPTGLRDLLLGDLDAFRKCLAEQVLTYALGRGLEYYDQCAVEEVAAAARDQGDTFSAILWAVVHSVPFQRSEQSEVGGQGPDAAVLP